MRLRCLIPKRVFLQLWLAYGLMALYDTRCRAFGAHLPYSVVYPKVIDARGDNTAKVLHISPNLIFNLEPSTVLGDRLTIITADGNSEEPNTDYIRERLYQDTDKLASLYLESTDAGILTEGVLGNDLRIVPLRGVSGMQDGAIPHKVFAIDNSEDYYGDIVEVEGSQPEPLLTERSSELPEAVYINIGVVVDSVSDDGLNRLNRSTMLYVIILVNAINIKYAQLNNPRFQVKLRVIQRLSASQEQEHLNLTGTLLPSDSVMTKFAKFIANDIYFNDTAAVFLLTGRDILGPGGRRGTMGIAFLRQLCTKNRVAMGEDIPGIYSGIPTAAHEILHIVGSLHDGSSGVPGAAKCTTGTHIMSPYATSKGSNFISNCTQEQVAFFLKRKGPTCWKRLCGTYLRRTVSAGRTIDANSFCLRANRTKYTGGKVDPDCRINCSTHKNTSEYFPSMDGMSCPSDPGKVCLSGKCVTRKEIPKTMRYGPERWQRKKLLQQISTTDV